MSRWESLFSRGDPLIYVAIRPFRLPSVCKIKGKHSVSRDGIQLWFQPFGKVVASKCLNDDSKNGIFQVWEAWPSPHQHTDYTHSGSVIVQTLLDPVDLLFHLWLTCIPHQHRWRQKVSQQRYITGKSSEMEGKGFLNGDRGSSALHSPFCCVLGVWSPQAGSNLKSFL